MASISSSSSSRPNHHTPTFTYDVFLSFRGEDTRHNFTDHLYNELLRAGLRVFRDNDDIKRGEELTPEIENAIMQSRASVVVLSKKYANSSWCLDELGLIMDQRRRCKNFVLPVFYLVDPSDVRKQTGTFIIEGSKRTGVSKCFTCVKAEKKSVWTEENVKQWKEALTDVANLGGMELSSSMSETSFIAELVETVQCKLDSKQLSTPAFLIGVEARVQKINSLLKDEQYNAIAICGMGGSGKTTLAQHIYNLNKKDFKSSSFVDVSRKDPYGMLGLQKQLLKDVSGGKKIRISNESEGTYKIEEILETKRVLIVLDDINNSEQLSALVGKKAFPTQSKIIITTRLLGIHEWFGSISWKCVMHKLSLMNDLESLELLSWHAFLSKTPMKGFEKLALQLAKYCGGNPLALKVLGSSLIGCDEKSWRSRMNSFNSLNENLDLNIQVVLQKSFDSLPISIHKELFLHIACFFVGEFRKLVETILEDDCNAVFGISTLIEKSLLTISADGKLMMHQLLQKMGRRIVCEESKDPTNRSRVWHNDESYEVLRKGEGSYTIEGLALDIRKVEQGMPSKTPALETSSLENMGKLKLLQLKYVQLNGSYENFPNLIWLCWQGCPLKTVPSGLLVSSLVAIDMSDGDMEMFEAPTVLNSLKHLNLKGCDKLFGISNLYRLPKVESLILLNCSSLNHLCTSIGDLKNLYILDLGGCTKLWKYVNQILVNPENPLFSLPKSLMWLNLENNNLERTSNVCLSFHVQSSVNLTLSVNPFEYLPDNINLQTLHTLNLYSCPNLKSLSCIPSTLMELHIDWCTSLEKVTFHLGRFTLHEFSYEGCSKLSEIQGLFKLEPIAKTSEADLGHMHWIKAYEDHMVDLIGDDITKGRTWHTQILYEYGIMSTYLQGIKDQIMTTYEYTSSCSFLFFRVPCHHEKHRVEGLNISCIYRSSQPTNKDRWILLAKISNKTKGLTWIYNPVVYCKPNVDEDVVWLSYWPIGNVLDAGDEVHVEIIHEKENMIVSGCSVSFVYTDSEVERERNYTNNLIKDEEVIGGDLSGFEVTEGGYYLCRRDLFALETSLWLKQLFGDNIDYPDSHGWKKTHQSMRSWVQRYSLNTSLRRLAP